MFISKATKQDIENTKEFIHAVASVTEGERWATKEAYDQWEEWDDEDPDKKLILKIRKWIAEEMEIKEKHVDNRIVMYEFIYEKQKLVQRSEPDRVIWAADALIKNCCDAQEDHLAFTPQLFFKHVAAEQ